MSGWHGGKGSGRRKGADDEKYRDNYERIFGKRDRSKPKGDSNEDRPTEHTQSKRSNS